MAAMTMPVRSVRVRAGIVEIHFIVTNTVVPALDLGGCTGGDAGAYIDNSNRCTEPW